MKQANANDNIYIFKQSFITPKSFKNYNKNVQTFEQKNIKYNYEKINNNFDLLYSILVNKIISHLYETYNMNYINKMKNIYKITYYINIY